MLQFIFYAVLWILFFIKTVLITLILFLWNFTLVFPVYSDNRQVCWFYSMLPYSMDESDLGGNYTKYKTAWHALFNIK